MALETASTIAELNASNPVGASDTPASLDDHIRLIKTVLKADALVVANKGAANGVASLDASSKVVQTALLADSATTATTATAANGLKTATTTVAVSSATAPSSGQVLTATSSTAAEWATPSSVSFASSAENAAGTVENKAVDPLGIREAFSASGSAPVYACRAWVNFDATRNASGGSDTNNTNRFIRASGNVASVLKNADGDFTITFSTAMADANYAASGGAAGVSGSYSILLPNTSTPTSTAYSAPSTSACRVCVVSASANAGLNPQSVDVVIFR